MEWITVRRHRDARVALHKTLKASKAYGEPYEFKSLSNSMPQRLDPTIVQRLILRRMGICLSQDHADALCGFSPHTVNAIESHRLYPTTTQLVTLDAHLTILEELQRR